MRIIKNSKDITTLEVGDKVVFGNLEYEAIRDSHTKRYYLGLDGEINSKIFKILNINKRDFVEHLGIDANCNVDFPETKSLEALTAIVSALFKEYEKQNELPKTWEEFCIKYPLKEDEVYIGSTSEFINVEESLGRRVRLCGEDRNLCISKQEAEAFLALMQLRQLRKVYVKDWEPLLNEKNYYCILNRYDGLSVENYFISNRPLSFPTKELAKQFLNNFKDLLEIAKPLL